MKWPLLSLTEHTICFLYAVINCWVASNFHMTLYSPYHFQRHNLPGLSIHRSHLGKYVSRILRGTANFLRRNYDHDPHTVLVLLGHHVVTLTRSTTRIFLHHDNHEVQVALTRCCLTSQGFMRPLLWHVAALTSLLCAENETSIWWSGCAISCE